MKTSSRWNFGSILGKMMMGLVLAAMIGSVDIAPALAKNDHNKGKHDNRHYDHRGHGHKHHKPVYRPYGYYRPHAYRERVYYPPPPVVYEPVPAPGISIFFPPIFIGP